MNFQRDFCPAIIRGKNNWKFAFSEYEALDSVLASDVTEITHVLNLKLDEVWKNVKVILFLESLKFLLYCVVSTEECKRMIHTKQESCHPSIVRYHGKCYQQVATTLIL